MIGITTDKVCADIRAVCALTRFNDHMRSHVAEEPDLSDIARERGANNYVEARRHVPEAVQWKVFAHCAGVTRLYALYEGFVYELVSAWLRLLPSVYGSYERMPEAVLNQHRAGVGVLLQKLGGGARTEDLTELGILEPLYLGLNGKPFSLMPEAFFIELRNLRQSELTMLFTKVSLGNVGNWLNRHDGLAALCDAEGTTPEARLKDLVEYRNDASHAHGEIDETLGVSAFQGIADFIEALCGALHQFVLFQYVDALQNVGKLEKLGKVTEYYDGPQAAILTSNAATRISVGEEIIVRAHLACYRAKITSIQDHDVDVQVLDAAAEQEVGLKFEPPVEKNALIFRLRAEPSGGGAAGSGQPDDAGGGAAAAGPAAAEEVLAGPGAPSVDAPAEQQTEADSGEHEHTSAGDAQTEQSSLIARALAAVARCLGWRKRGG